LVIGRSPIRREGEVLLGMKKRGFGKGKWNGFGGKVEPGETIPQAAAREVLEECGLTVVPSSLHETATINFEFKGDPVLLEVHLFQTSEFSGKVAESDEMRPQWFKEAEVPFSEMWVDDKLWFPLMLQKKKFAAFFLMEGHEKMLEKRIVPL